MLPGLLVLTASLATPPASEPAPAAANHSGVTCAKLNRYFQPHTPCAGPGLYPFERHPRVCPVAVCPCEGVGCDGGAVGKDVWVKEFTSAAHVPFPRFDADGQCVPGDGLVIYEGMRLTVHPATGEYDLTFTATVPNMPVRLRMQLQFTHKDGERTYTLTLPLILLEPKGDAKPGDPSAWTFNVAHRGYSTLFRGAFQTQSLIPPVGNTGRFPIDSTWAVKREGTARFGTAVVIEDPSR